MRQLYRPDGNGEAMYRAHRTEVQFLSERREFLRQNHLSLDRKAGFQVVVTHNY